MQHHISITEIIKQLTKQETLSPVFLKMYQSALLSLKRYEQYMLLTQQISLPLDMANVSSDRCHDFIYFLYHEQKLSITYPKVFQQLYAQTNRQPLKHERGTLAVNNIIAMIKAVLRKTLTKKQCLNNALLYARRAPNVCIEPYYMSIEERNLVQQLNIRQVFLQDKTRTIHNYHFSIKQLQLIKDAFIFQCYVGCRYTDLKHFVKDNVYQEMLVYTPHKTIKHGRQARVPLLRVAKQIWNRYATTTTHSPLFNIPNNNMYNYGIKLLLRTAGIKRCVEILNPQTNTTILKPLYEVASSHLARRTFIAILYLEVQDPNLIAKMSGHAEGSTAFRRYRKIEDATLRKIIKAIE